MIRRDATPGRGQRGLTLLLSLLLITVLSLLALAASSDGLLQQRVTHNLDQSSRSSDSASSALLWAEDWLLAQGGNSRPEPCTDNCGPSEVIRPINTYPAAPEYESPGWWLSNAHADGSDPVSGAPLEDRSGGLNVPGRWIVEEVWYEDAPADDSGRPATSYYRIIARGAGRDGFAAVSESILARPWGDQTWADDFPAGFEAESFCRSQPIEGPCGRLAWRQRR